MCRNPRPYGDILPICHIVIRLPVHSHTSLYPIPQRTITPPAKHPIIKPIHRYRHAHLLTIVKPRRTHTHAKRRQPMRYLPIPHPIRLPPILKTRHRTPTHPPPPTIIPPDKVVSLEYMPRAIRRPKQMVIRCRLLTRHGKRQSNNKRGGDKACHFNNVWLSYAPSSNFFFISAMLRTVYSTFVNEWLAVGMNRTINVPGGTAGYLTIVQNIP